MAKYSDDIREKALALYDQVSSISKVAKELGIPKTTVSDWIKNREIPEEVVLRKAIEKIDFTTSATNIIEKSMKLMEKRLDDAIDFEEEFGMFLEEISRDKEIKPASYKSILAKIQALQIAKTSDLTQMVGTLYDKRALAKGESTASTSIKIEMDEDVSEWAK